MVRRWGRVAALIIMIMLTLSLTMSAQQQQKESENTAKPAERPWNFYKLTLLVRELDGSKVVSSRTYELTQRGGDQMGLRVGSKVPVVDSHNNLSYQDVGLNVDSRIYERGTDVSCDWRLELSSLAPELSNGYPVVRNVKSFGQTLLVFGKPVLMTSVDDLNSTHKFVFEVTATQIK